MMKLAIYAGTFDPITLGHVDLVERCAEIFDELECSSTPIRLDVKKLKGHQDVYRIRVSGWRIIYRFDKKDKFIQVYDILPRKSAYRIFK